MRKERAAASVGVTIGHMGLAYVVALIVSLGFLVVQVFFPGGSDGEAELDADGDASGAALLLSTRFWTYAALAFGMVGTPLHYLGLASSAFTLVLAVLSGLGSGTFVSFAFRALRRASTTTTAALDESLGQIGRVLVPCSRGRVGKVRLNLKGHAIDALATTDEEEISVGQRVLVAEVRGGVVHVAIAPEELLA